MALCKVLTGTALLPALTLSSVAYADIVTTTGNFSAFDLANFYSYQDGEDTSGNLVSVSSEAITGLIKFDPALGTLLSATISANFQYSVDSSITVFSGIDEISDPSHSAEFTVDSGVGSNNGQGFIQTGYVEALSFFPLTTEFFSAGTGCSGNFDDVGCENLVSDNYPSYDATGNLLTPPQSNFIPQSEFVGTGSIDSLKMSIILPDGSAWNTSNVFDAEGEVNIYADAGTVSIAYEYSPSPVPVPAALPLFGSALGLMGFAGWRKRKQRA